MKTSTYQTVVILAIGLTALYVARDVLLPLALAALLTFLLTPVVSRLERFRVPRVAAVLLTVLAVAGVSGVVCYGAAEQVLEIAARLPEYRQNLHDKFGAASQWLRPWSEHVRAAEKVVSDISGKSPTGEQTTDKGEKTPPGETAVPSTAATADTQNHAPTRPVKVTTPGEVAKAEEWSALELFKDWFVPVISPLATAAIVIVFTIFMLVEREDLRNRFIVLCGVERVPGTTEALMDAADRVSRYLRMQLLINCAYGIALGIACWAVGLPNPLLWAGLGALARFVPYAGVVVAAGLPIAVAVAVTDGWTMVLVLAVVIAALELIVANVLEPWLFGSSTGVSPSGILISAFFWTWLWGGVGLLLATPLTVLLTITGRQVPALRFMTTLFSDEPPLSPAARLYQRLLARDTQEAVRIVEAELAAHHSLPQTADLLVQPVTQVVADEAHGLVDRERLDAVLESLQEVEAELSDVLTAEETAAPAQRDHALLLAPARTQADAVVAELLALTLNHQGNSATALARSVMASDLARQIGESHADVLVLCAVGPRGLDHCRYVLRRLNPAETLHQVILLILGGTAPTAAELPRVAGGVDLTVVTSAADLTAKIESGTIASRSTSQTSRTPVTAA